MYIDVNELELNVATKSRAASMDPHNLRKAQTTAGVKGNSNNNEENKSNNLPDIVSKGSTLP